MMTPNFIACLRPGSGIKVSLALNFVIPKRAVGARGTCCLHAASQLMWRQPPRLSAERSDARVERTLLSVAFDLDLESKPARPNPYRAGAPARFPTPKLSSRRSAPSARLKDPCTPI